MVTSVMLNEKKNKPTPKLRGESPNKSEMIYIFIKNLTAFQIPINSLVVCDL